MKSRWGCVPMGDTSDPVTEEVILDSPLLNLIFIFTSAQGDQLVIRS
ncbi:hypothetical protein HanIR_Chr12g0607821 [Helianthus annuus]|nr:hypothetical protein HanIR_Chr12g0607821 [Helianthus annuus]